MGTQKEDKYLPSQEPKKFARSCIVSFWMFLVSTAGGVILGYWEYEYHPTNTQLWMVPFGLILFVTPVLIWFVAFVSESCNSKDNIENPRRSQP